MSPKRRVIKKLPPASEQAFDDRLWPVNVALLVLGSFLYGMAIVYLPADAPWWKNRLTWLIAIPLVIGGTMAALRRVDNRRLRRAVQLAVVVSLILHVALTITSLETFLFSSTSLDRVASRDLVEPQREVVIPEYARHHFQDPQQRPKEDFERPVETDTPESQPQELARQETQPEPKSREPQPTPVPDPLPTDRPNVVKRQQPADAVPRQSEEASQLSRRKSQPTVQPNQLADAAPSETAARAANERTMPQSAAAAVARQAAPSAAAPRADAAENANPAAQPNPNVARRSDSSTPQPTSAAAPTLRRQTATPQVTPRAAVAAADTPTNTQRTTDEPLRPQTTLAQKQQTASPTNTPMPSAVPPDSSTTASTVERRQDPAEARPTLAQTPTPSGAQRVRNTPRPDPATVAERATPTPTTVGEATRPPLEARTSPVARATPSVVDTARASPDSPPTPSPATPSASPTTPRRAASATAAPQATAAAPAPAPTTPRRTTSANSPSNSPATAAAEATAVAAAQQNSAEGLNASSTALRKQDSAAAEVARASGDAAAATSRSAPTEARVSGAARSATAVAAPNVAATAGSGPGRRTAATAPNVVTNAQDVAANAGPQVNSELAPTAAASSVARQATGAQGDPVSQTPLDAPAASPSAQLAQTAPRRSASSAAVPSLNPTAPAGASPSRAMTAAATAASPANVESPAASIATTGSSEPSAQPAKLALARGAAGMAGAGSSANMDRTSPASDRPALVASGAARRAQATQTDGEGPAFAPSDPALVRRSVADASRPSSTLQAENVDYATTGGESRPSELNASASAAQVAARSNATNGSVSAAQGALDVDLGPTQIVSEGGAGRASGGGQPELNLRNPAQMIARARSGGAPQASVAATELAAAPVAPPGTSGGSPSSLQPLATTTVRTQAGGEQPASGGPTSGKSGPMAEVAAAPALADAPVSRADVSEGSGGAGGGQPQLGDEDEEERRRRLARAAAGGGPQLALQGPAMIEAPAAGGSGGGGSPAGDLAGPAVAANRAAPAGGAAAGPSGAAEPLAGGQSAGELAGASRVTRAEAVDAAAGLPIPGGGTASRARNAGGAALVTNTQADVPSLAGAPQSGGVPQGSPLEAQGLATARAGDGVRGATTPGPTGALAGEVAIDGRLTPTPGAAPGSRASGGGAADTPALGKLADSGAALRRAGTSGAAAGVGATGPVEVPALPAEVAQANEDHLGGLAASAPMARKAAGAALDVDLAAVEGPGGLGSRATPDVGVNTRRAATDSSEVQLRPARFQGAKAGGVLNVSTAAVVPTDPFRGRAGRQPGNDGGNGSPPPQTEESVELGLAFLARFQSPDGSWQLKGFNEDVQLSSDSAATALALLAFQGAGYNHREHKYKDNVRAALDWLLKNQKEDGDLFLPADDESNRSVWLYSHSIAALALCEAYGMTQDPMLREPAQKALDFIVAGQHRERGGWRYAPGVGADTSVTGWMMMALKSGELAGLKVPPETYVKMRRWLDTAQASATEKHLYRYNPYAPDTEAQRHGRTPTKTMTSVGLLLRLYTGWKRDNPDLIRGADYLKAQLPAIGTPRDPQRDTYYWYYATQVMFHMGGDYWTAWNGQLHPLLTRTQIKQGALAGSWDPNGAVPDRWAPHAGRLYVTVMNLLSLEVYYRHLPLYGDTAK